MKIQLLFFIFCSAQLVNAQPDIEWQKTIGTSLSERFVSLRPAADNGFFIACQTNAGINGDKTEDSRGLDDYWVLKIDGLANIEWQKTLGGSKSDFLTSIAASSDGGCIVGGYSISDSSGDKTEDHFGFASDFWIVKLDNQGAIEWDNTIGGIEFDAFRMIIQTSDGGYLLTGNSRSGIGGDKTDSSYGDWDYWVVKLDPGGTIEWQSTLGGSLGDIPYAILETSDGGYAVGGFSKSGISGTKTDSSRGGNDYWILKLDNMGSVVWQKTYGGDDEDALIAMQQTDDGGYIVGGYSLSGLSGDKTDTSFGESDIWILKLDSIGIIEWQRTLGGNDDDQIWTIELASDGGYILAGASDSEVSGTKTDTSRGSADFWTIKLNSIGNIEWQKTIGGSNVDYFNGVLETSDGSLMMAGGSTSAISGDKTINTNGLHDFWILKLSFNTTSTEPTVFDLDHISINPNPNAGKFMLELKGESSSSQVITISNIHGQRVLLTSSNSTSKVEVDLSLEPAGVYFIQIDTEGSSYFGKVIKE